MATLDPIDIDRVIVMLRQRAAHPANVLTTPIGTELLLRLLDELAEARARMNDAPEMESHS